MPRTPEQRDADDNLTEAIETVWRAYDPDDDDPGLLTDYLVLVVRRGFNDEGDPWSCVGSLSRDDSVPAHIQLGLLEQKRASLVTPDFCLHEEE